MSREMSFRAVRFILILISILCYAVEISCYWTPPPTQNPSQVELDVLNAHNMYRAKHGVPPLKLNKDLSKYASDWAHRLLLLQRLEHRKQDSFGENLYYAKGAGLDGASAVDAWYSEIKDYDFNDPWFSAETGHFTQVIWKDSKNLGVGVSQHEDTMYIVCNYDPPGNVIGGFDTNVLPA